VLDRSRVPSLFTNVGLRMMVGLTHVKQLMVSLCFLFAVSTMNVQRENQMYLRKVVLGKGL